MASPYVHALNSVKKWGGDYKRYLPIHEFIDSTKLHFAGWQHRAILHNTFGVGLCERIFGEVIDNGEGEMIEVRYIAIKHIEEDCGIVPTIKDWVKEIPSKAFSVNLNSKNKITVTEAEFPINNIS